MPRGFQLGRLFGTDIYATPGFFGLLAVYFFVFGTERMDVAAVFCLAVVVSLLIHEYGHVYAARRAVGGAPFIVLWSLGGLCVHDPAPLPRQQVTISLMGPAFQFLSGAACWLALTWIPGLPPLVMSFLEAMAWIGFVWVALNLLPILPLDGGNALRAALATRRGFAKANLYTRRVSVVTAALIIPVGIVLRAPFLTLLAAMFLVQNLGLSRGN